VSSSGTLVPNLFQTKFPMYIMAPCTSSLVLLRLLLLLLLPPFLEDVPNSVVSFFERQDECYRYELQ